MTEADAARAYALAWNSLDPTNFIDLLAEDSQYASQWVFEELNGKAAISDCLAGKIEAVRRGVEGGSQVKVFAELAKATKSFPGRPCVLMAQENRNNIKSAVLFEVEDHTIKRFDMCLSDILGPIGSGKYPGS